MENSSLDDFVDAGEDESETEESDSPTEEHESDSPTREHESDSPTEEDDSVFGVESDAESGVASDAETAVESDAEGGEEPEQAVTTSRWTRDMDSCDACGQTVRRLWIDDGEFVCHSCKDWG